MYTIIAHGFTRSSAWPIPAQLSFTSSSFGKSNEPAAVSMPSICTGSVSPAFSAYFAMVFAPTLRVSAPKAPLHDWARASLKSTSPCAVTSVSLESSPSPTWLTPSHSNVNESLSDMLSMTAAAVTSLNVEPGVSSPSRKLLKKYEFSSSAEASGHMRDRTSVCLPCRPPHLSSSCILLPSPVLPASASYAVRFALASIVSAIFLPLAVLSYVPFSMSYPIS